MPRNARTRRLYVDNLRRRFKTSTWDETGIFGFQPDDLANANPGGGALVAHDVMEHICHAPDSTSDEVAAFGTLWHLRLDSGWYPRNGGRFDAAGLASELGGVLRDAYYGDDWGQREGWPMHDPYAWDPKTTQPMHCEYIEDALLKCAIEACRIGQEEIYMGEDDAKKEEIRVEFVQFDLQNRMLGWLRHGYQVSERRYEKIGVDHASWLFDLISENVDKLKNMADGIEEIQLDVSINTKKGTCILRCPELEPGLIRIDPSDGQYGIARR